jgi:general secretion pathway protein F
LKKFKVSFFYHGYKKSETFQVESKSHLFDSFSKKYPNLQILSYNEIFQSEKIEKIKIFLIEFLNLQKVNDDSKIVFISQIAIMRDSGIQILDILNNTKSNDKNLNQAVTEILKHLNNGLSLEESFKRVENRLDHLTSVMVQLGDNTGKFADAMLKLKKMLEESRENRDKLKKALAYPRNLLVAMGISLFVMIKFVVPQFQSIFARFNGELPIPTQILIWSEKFLSDFGIYIATSSIIGFFLSKYYLKKSKSFAKLYFKFLLKIPVIRELETYSNLYRFSLIFSELVNAGNPIFKSLEISISMVENLIIREKLETAKNKIDFGGTIYSGFIRSEIFDNIALQMVNSAEQSGKVGKMFLSISEYYKRKFQQITENMSSLLEPLFLALMGGLVTLLALGIFLPIWNLGEF